MITEDALLERVQSLGLHSVHARVAVRATLEALGAVLVKSERRAVSEGLSQALRESFETSIHLPDTGLEGFFERVQHHEGVPSGQAREHAQIVCRALSEGLPAEVLTALGRHVPWLLTLFEGSGEIRPPEQPERLQRPRPAEVVDHTLADGRPGSRHPLSDSHPERAQRHSIARSDDPHGDTKLSSARGFTQEREQETLSAGRPPGPKRPISG